MAIEKSDFWTILLWDNYLPFIESGAPFYLAADSLLIHQWIRKYDQEINIEDALDSFRQACLSLLDRTSTRAHVKDIAFARVPGKIYSRAICLAVQQVLVVERMLAKEQYSERSYFPPYRDVLGITGGNIHVNPIDDFQRIWSVLRYEIISIPGSSDESITFLAGAGMDVNRSLPLSQALFTTHDLSIIYKECADKLRRASTDEPTLIQIFFQARCHLNRRAQSLISKATTDVWLCNRLCQQVRSFIVEERVFFHPHRPRKLNERNALIAYLDTESWLEDRYCIYSRLLDGSQSAENATLENLIAAFADCTEVGIALAAREDRFEEINTLNPFEHGDVVISVVKAAEKERFIKKFTDFYRGSVPTVCQSNLPEQFLLIYCGELQNSGFFDPLGRRTNSQQTSALQLKGGLIADGRSRTFLAGYPPSGITYKGNPLLDETILLVNGVQCRLGVLLEKLAKQRNLTSYVLEFKEERLEFKIAPTANTEKSNLLFGFSMSDNCLGPTPMVLNENQPSLRGTVFIEDMDQRKGSFDEVTTRDLILLIDNGKRIRLIAPLIDQLLNRISQAPCNKQLIDIATRQISMSKSVPIRALQVGCLKQLRS